MRWNSHSELRGRHAFLSPSNYHWVNYTPQKLEARYHAWQGAARGTALHDFAKNAILLGVGIVGIYNEEDAMSAYVADCINLRLSPEQYLYYSDNCFGQSDAIGLVDGVLYVFDLKTGAGPVMKFTQLEIYAALFCLEYMVAPHDIGFDLRIYQREEIRRHEPYSDTIQAIMDRIQEQDSLTEALKEA